MMTIDLWSTPGGEARVLRGVALISGAPRLAELIGHCGLDVVWLDVEHGSVPSGEIEMLCMATERGGAIPCVRVPDASRRHILWALEWGAQLVVVPLVNDAQTARQIVEHGKFAPVGKRGYNSRSRGVQYGLGAVSELFAQANARTHLLAQIETRQAVENVEAICAVEGLSGIFIGPGDLSSDYGCVGQANDARIIAAAVRCIRIAREAGKHAGILVLPGPLQEAAVEAGTDLIIGTSDIGELAQIWQAQNENRR